MAPRAVGQGGEPDRSDVPADNFRERIDVNVDVDTSVERPYHISSRIIPGAD